MKTCTPTTKKWRRACVSTDYPLQHPQGDRLPSGSGAGGPPGGSAEYRRHQGQQRKPGDAERLRGRSPEKKELAHCWWDRIPRSPMHMGSEPWRAVAGTSNVIVDVLVGLDKALRAGRYRDSPEAAEGYRRASRRAGPGDGSQRHEAGDGAGRHRQGRTRRESRFRSLPQQDDDKIKDDAEILSFV